MRIIFLLLVNDCCKSMSEAVRCFVYGYFFMESSAFILCLPVSVCLSLPPLLSFFFLRVSVTVFDLFVYTVSTL